MWAALEGPHFRHIVPGVKNAQCADDTVIISYFGKKSIVFLKKAPPRSKEQKGKIMSKKSFNASQRAHAWWQKHHERKMRSTAPGKKQDVHFTKRNYHSLCIFRQQKLGRKLTFVEKKKAYDDTVKAFF